MNKNNAKKINKSMKADTKVFQATVTSITNKQCQVLFEDKTMLCLIPSSLVTDRNSLAVGDQVEVGLASDDQYKLLTILPRKTAIYRGIGVHRGRKYWLRRMCSFFWRW